MATSNEKIAAGLNQRERGPSIDRFVALQPGDDGKSKLPSASLIRERAASARNKLTQLQQVRDHVDKAAQKAREQAESEVEALKGQLTKDQRRKIVAQRERDARRKAAEHWQPTRDAAMAALRDYAGGLDVLQSIWGSPSAMLTSKALGSEKSSRYLAQLASAGEAQLAVTIRLAIAEKNTDLAFAALSAADARGIRVSDIVHGSRDEVAEAVLGSAWSEVGEGIKTLSHAGQDAIVIEREITTGKRDGLATLNRGLRDLENHGRDGAGDPAGEGGDGE